MRRVPGRLCAVVFCALLASCGARGALTPSVSGSQPASFSSDWSTFGVDLARSGDNPHETTLGISNARSLAERWVRDLGSAIDAQPLYAAGVKIGAVKHDVVYVGTEGGAFYALDAGNGDVLWTRSLGSTTSGCDDLPGGVFGITGTATFDRAKNRVYVADGQDVVHALDMGTGAEAPGWPVTVTSAVSEEHIYSALTYNPANGLLYAQTAGYCDVAPYQSRLVAIDTSSASVVATFLPAGTLNGGGLWGMGGPSIDTATNDVFVATGNTVSTTSNAAYGEQVVRLTANLAVEASNYPGLVDDTRDYDFGSTPMLFHAQGCPLEFTAQNKDGTLFVYTGDDIAAGPLQSIDMADDSESGQFIGVAAYSPQQNLVYVGDPAGYGGYDDGLVAFSVTNCTLTLAWQTTEGSTPPDDDNVAASVANGVVYSVDGIGDQVFANNAQTGAALWNSGSLITGPVFAPPSVAGGTVYVGSWNHTLYAFALP